MNRVQKLKKKAGVSPADSLVIGYQVQGDDEGKRAVRALFESQGPTIRAALRHPIKEIVSQAIGPATAASPEDRLQARSGARGRGGREEQLDEEASSDVLLTELEGGDGGNVVGESVEELSVGSMSVSIRLVMSKYGPVKG